MDKQQFVNQGMHHFAEQNYERAIKYFRMALDCDDSFETAYSALCESLNRIDKIDEAFKVLQCWLKINDQNPKAHLILSKLLAQKGHGNDARLAMQTYLKLKRTGRIS